MQRNYGGRRGPSPSPRFPYGVFVGVGFGGAFQIGLKRIKRLLLYAGGDHADKDPDDWRIARVPVLGFLPHQMVENGPAPQIELPDRDVHRVRYLERLLQVRAQVLLDVVEDPRQRLRPLPCESVGPRFFYSSEPTVPIATRISNDFRAVDSTTPTFRGVACVFPPRPIACLPQNGSANDGANAVAETANDLVDRSAHATCRSAGSSGVFRQQRQQNLGDLGHLVPCH